GPGLPGPGRLGPGPRPGPWSRPGRPLPGPTIPRQGVGAPRAAPDPPEPRRGSWGPFYGGGLALARGGPGGPVERWRAGWRASQLHPPPHRTLTEQGLRSLVEGWRVLPYFL